MDGQVTEAGPDVSIDRYEVAAGWFPTRNVLLKVAYVRRKGRKVTKVLARKVKRKPVAQVIAVGPKAANSGSVPSTALLHAREPGWNGECR